MEFTAKQLADFLQGTVEGDLQAKVCDFSRIEEGKEGTLSFLANPKYEHYIYTTQASIVLVNQDFIPSRPVTSTLIRVPDAYKALAALMAVVEQTRTKKTGIDSTASIASTATTGEHCYIGSFAYIGENSSIGNNCQIYPYVYIGDHVTIADNTIIYPHVSVYSGCVIGQNVILHAGCVVGADGFGFAFDKETGKYTKIPQQGNVVIEDDVEIGANTTIDRAAMSSTSTVIHRGVKLDNLVQIAHNVEVGENTVMASQAGISGSVKIGKRCQLGGQAGLSGHIRIEDDVKIGAQAGVISDVAANRTILGAPAIDARDFMRSSVIFNRLPELSRTVSQLQREIEQLKKEINK
ncbi:MAG: UDP-3-O-(3-hydroxymyristoyl)glucosamine N-acyltransferase [Tannerellaceae bacterium]|nr:UDP-3-O-(3-hydroxymyristoyl)glucosamine N-acyltransferase [Tannerellaceae bacterium]